MGDVNCSTLIRRTNCVETHNHFLQHVRGKKPTPVPPSLHLESVNGQPPDSFNLLSPPRPSRKSKNSQVCQDAIEKVARRSVLLGLSQEMCLRPQYRSTPRAQLDPHPVVLALDVVRLRFRCSANSVQYPDHSCKPQVDHCVPVEPPVFLITTVPIKLISHTNIQQVPDARNFSCKWPASSDPLGSIPHSEWASLGSTESGLSKWVLLFIVFAAFLGMKEHRNLKTRKNIRNT